MNPPTMRIQKSLWMRLQKKHNMKTVSIENAESVDLSEYDIMGLAAGIAFGKLYKRMEEFAAKIPSGKRAFLLYTCGNPSGGYVKSITKTLESNGVKVMGSYGCRGYDTYGPFKLVGGIVLKQLKTCSTVRKRNKKYARYDDISG